MEKRRIKTPSKAVVLLPVIILLTAGFLWQILTQLRQVRLLDFQRYNIVFAGPAVVLVSLFPAQSAATVLTLPEDLYVEVAGGYGQYRLGKVMALGDLDRRGGIILAQTVSDLVGAPVDGYLRFSFDAQNPLNLKNLLLALKRVQTNLPPLDLGKVIWAVSQVTPGKQKTISLEKIPVTEELVLADGSKAQYIDTQKLDYFLDGVFLEPVIRREGERVEIVNLGEINGLGAAAARLVTNIGGNVINVQSDVTNEPCQIQTENSQSQTARRLSKLFNCPVVKREPGRAEVTVRLRALRPDE